MGFILIYIGRDARDLKGFCMCMRCQARIFDWTCGQSDDLHSFGISIILKWKKCLRQKIKYGVLKRWDGKRLVDAVFMIKRFHHVHLNAVELVEMLLTSGFADTCGLFSNPFLSLFTLFSAKQRFKRDATLVTVLR